MPVQTFPMPRRPSTPTLIAVLAALGAGSAHADEPSPYYIGASQSIAHDSNVYRTSVPISDSYATTSLLGGFDQSIGRQHFSGSANIGYNKYRSQDVLNNTSYGANLGWDWQTINELSGGVNGSMAQSLATQNGNQPVFDANGNPIVPTTARNLVKTDQVNANVRWGGSGPLSLGGAYSHSRVDYSATPTSESTGDSASINSYYRLGPTVTTSLGVRYTRTRSPFGIADPTSASGYTSNTSTGKNLDLGVTWRVSPQTGFDARLSFTRQSNSVSDGQDFSGLTGGFSGNYAATAKLNFSASYSRDTGTNGSFFNVTQVDTGGTVSNVRMLSENSTVSDSVSLNAGYAATAKITTTASVQYRRSRNNTTGTSNGIDYSDTLKSATLAASYAITRGWNASCNLSRENRSVSTGSGFSYGDTTVGCTVQVTLR